jgi:Aspartyl protease
MSIRFPYVPGASPQPVWALRGRSSIPHPLVTLTVIGPGGASVQRCLLDTGADYTVFPEQIATAIGLDLSASTTGTAYPVGGGAATIRFAEVGLRLAGNGEFHEWQSRVGFCSIPMKVPLLGFAGFFEYFTATFFGDLEEVELSVNSKYSGT